MPSLYKFQVDGLNQVADPQHPETGDRSILVGDDMGLGKTIEAICLDNYRRKQHKCSFTAQTLIVTQTSVIGGWRDHYLGTEDTEGWAPWLRVKVIDRKNRDEFTKAFHEKLPNGQPAYHIFICHWQVLRFIADEVKAVKWFHVIGDEIQNIKNRKAQQTQIFKKLQTYYKLGLSGTWADNLPADAWSVLNWLWPKTWTSYWSFFNSEVIIKEKEVWVKGVAKVVKEQAGFANPVGIWARMGNCYLRRTKEEVWEDLPDRTYEDRHVDLLPIQRKTYDMMRSDMLAWVGKNEDQPLAAPSVISRLVRLQQFAVAYGEMEKHRVPTKRLDIDTGKREFVLDEEGNKVFHDEYVLVLTEPSSKLDAAMDLIEETNEQVVVFGQSKQAINLLAARLVHKGIPVGILTGDTSQAKRDLAIQQFQSGKLRVFVSTIKAGGVGITLTPCSTAIFLDWDWSPSKNKQAEDRIHRLGQKNACTYYRFVARDTVDRERNERIEMKWEWLKQILNPPKR